MTLFQNKYRIKSTRLKGWDYRSARYYFVALPRDRQHFFGEIADGEMRLSPLGQIATQFLDEIPFHTTGVEMDEFIVMPNHIHAIIVISTPAVVETLHATSLRMSAVSPKAGSLSAMVRSYKSAASYRARIQWEHIFWVATAFLRSHHP